eukprot:IDg13869t1
MYAKRDAPLKRIEYGVQHFCRLRSIQEALPVLQQA